MEKENKRRVLSKIKFRDMDEDKVILGEVIWEGELYIKVKCEKNFYELNRKNIYSIKTPNNIGKGNGNDVRKGDENAKKVSTV